MNNFIQAEEYFARKLEESCDEFDKFLRIEIARVNGASQLTEVYIKYLYHAARDNAQYDFGTDCNIFFRFCGFARNQHLTDFVASIYRRGVEKINTLTDYKLSLVWNKYERCQADNTRVDKYTLLEWLAQNQL